MEKHALQNRSFLQSAEIEKTKSPTIEAITLTWDSTQSSPLKVYNSSKKYDFIITSPDSPEIPTTFSSKLSSPKVEKAVEKIQRLKSTPKLIKNTLPLEPKTLRHGTGNLQSTPFENNQEPSTSNSNNDRQKQSLPSNEPQQQRETSEDEMNEEHYVPTASPGKSSISNIKSAASYAPEFY